MARERQTEPFSRERLQRFVEEQRFDIYATRQLRLIIEAPDGRSVGALDIFDFDPQMRRFGIGILIYDRSDRRQGYAASASRPSRDTAATRSAYTRYGARRARTTGRALRCSARRGSKSAAAAATGSLRQRAIATIS